MSAAARLARAVMRWREAPASFVRECLGAVPDLWQVDTMAGLLSHGRVSVSACHGPGKGATAAWVVLWCLVCWQHPKIPCTAPTQHQLYDLLWSEIAKWHAKMPRDLAALYHVGRERVERKKHAKTWFAMARTARKEAPQTLAGVHADVVLIVCDEASAVPDTSFEVLEGAMTGPRAFWLIIGNPTTSEGYFAATHGADPTQKPDDRWLRIRVMAEAAHDGSPLPPGVYLSPRVSRAYVDDMRAKYGDESNVYRVRVLGLFPLQDDDVTVPWTWAAAALTREIPENWTPKHEITAALDVARFGSDDCGLAVKCGRVALYLDAWHGHDTVATCARVEQACERLALLELCPRYLFVDGVGVGAGCVDLLQVSPVLRRLGVGVLDVQAGAESPDPECYRLRDALWWRARKDFDPKRGLREGECPVLPDTLDEELRQRLVAELSQPKYTITPGSNLVKIESKDDLKKRGKPSPDLADAWIMTYFLEVGAQPKETARERVAKAGKRGTWMAS